MSDWSSLLNIQLDPQVRQNWDNLLSTLLPSEDGSAINRGFLDQFVYGFADNWLERNDQCGVVQDLIDISVRNAVGSTFPDLANVLGRSNNNSTIGNETSTEIQSTNSGGLFAEETCSTFQSTVFLGGMMSFSSCADIEIGKLFGTVEENIVNVALKCLNTFLQPFQASKTCASRNFQNYVMDNCVKGAVSDDILGHVFQLFLITPKKTCECMSSLASIPACRVDVTRDISFDGMLASKMACVVESQICSKLEDECDHRLNVLDQCLPGLIDINNDNFDCEEVMCECERNDKGLLNYAGRAMELPMSDMCTDHAAENFIGYFIPERYEVFQEKCGAKYVHLDDPPSMAPTISAAPTAVNLTQDNIIAGLMEERADTPVNSVVSGILIALAITGIASIFLVFILVLWRRRHGTKEKELKTIPEMKAYALAQIQRLEEDVRKMDLAQEKIQKLEADIRRMEHVENIDVEDDAGHLVYPNRV